MLDFQLPQLCFLLLKSTYSLVMLQCQQCNIHSNEPDCQLSEFAASRVNSIQIQKNFLFDAADHCDNVHGGHFRVN